MKDKKRIFIVIMMLVMLFGTLLADIEHVNAESMTKYIKVNQTTLEFKQIIYINGTNGSDSLGDGSKENPFATVVKGFDFMNVNCREEGAIIISEGTYSVDGLFDKAPKYNLKTKYDKLKVSLFAETMGKVSFRNIGEWILVESINTGRIKLSFYGIIFSHHLQSTNVLGADDWTNEFYNCIFTDGYSGYNYVVPTANIKVENCLFTGNMASFGELPNYILSGSSINCASTTDKMEPFNGTKMNQLFNVTIDSNYNITSTGWKNCGTGTNPDGSKAHIGVYGGQFAWGSKVEVANEALKILKVVLEPEEQLQLSIDNDLSENNKMTWTSSNPETAAVDAAGLIKAVKKGNAIITVESADKSYKEEIKVLVVEDAKKYRLAIDLKVGDKARLTIDDAADQIGTWDVMDCSIATVTDKGRVTAVAAGLTIVTALDENGAEVGQVYIRVR